MLETKWFTLLQQIHRICNADERYPQTKTRLIDTFQSTRQRLTDINSRDHSDDWIAQEAFTLVVSELLTSGSLDGTTLNELFDLLMTVKLHRLALILVNSSASQWSVGELPLKRALALFQLGERESARQSLQQALALTPDNHLCHFHLGYLEVWSGEMEQAVAAFNRCLELAPDYAGAHQNLAGCHYQSSEFQLAIDSCQRAHRLQPGIAATYITATSACIALKRFDDADQWLQRAREFDFSTPEFMRLHGLVAHFQSRHQQACDSLSQYLQLHPRSYDLMAIRARSLLELEQWHAVIDDTQALLKLDPFDEWCLEKLFLAYFNTGQYANAEGAMAELGKLFPAYKLHHQHLLDQIRQHQAIPVQLK
ncbi:Tetratricopeptide repeat-containing protein [Ferrimonas sediminum]|uniref:Tetratricopeptide repeat-containing protein n=1 Tax=Ferrimonas sediminum TaxID=718193 RepID=A0A1G8P1J0_9GAMM|nr:tetratricopeptide repeat protein [Ferrimonas sediminum]SDI86411.1 Tetratricopeptide repeat-containing protein [Ferrimonas sediminum]